MLITIGRQYGAGGREVGEKLAKKLQIPLYDRKLVAFISAHMEKGVDLDNLNLDYENLYGSVSPYETMLADIKTKDDNYLFRAQSKAIQALAKKGDGIFIGRCANYILKDFDHAYHFFVVADDDFRKIRGETVYHKSLDFLKTEDEKRGSYYNYYTLLKWGNPEDYDLTINTGKAGIDKAVEIISDYIKAK